jgi:hypothetical protein
MRLKRAVLPVLAMASVLSIAFVQPAFAETRTFGFTGAEQTYTVPADVSAIHVVAIGAKGGKGTSNVSAGGGPGGFGARVEAELAVAPGQVLFVEVGGAGENGSRRRVGTGGFNGGGSSFGVVPGGGGGGATDVRSCSINAPACSGTDALTSRLLVAGGGGGGGALGRGLAGVGGEGGNAGANGSPGQVAGCDPGLTPGGGGGAGTLSAGGAGGAAGNNGAGPGDPGVLGVGGGAPTSMTNPDTGGGGGGGYFGGGAGGGTSGCHAGGGGGGSSFTSTGAKGVSVTTDSSGQAGVVITTVASKPSNAFRIGTLSRNKRRGTARLAVELPGPGELRLAGKGLVGRRLSLGGPGGATLAIKAKGALARKLVRVGQVKLRAAITFTPSGGDPRTLARSVKLIKR